MDSRGIFWSRRRTRRFGASWMVPLVLIALWVLVTAATLWELGTLGPSLSALAALPQPAYTDERDVVASRPKLLF